MASMIVETAKPRSCFLHVPKSGGTALTLYLQNVLGAHHVFHVGEGRYRKVPLEGLMRRYPVVTGHFNVGQIPERLFQTTFFFSFLREPVDRIISMFHFFKEGDLDSDHRVVINEEWDLARALDKWVRPGSCSAWSNEQTFLFSGETDLEQPPEDLLPRALRNLERFDFVGLHEQFAAGVECLGRLRGWPLHAPVPRFKTSRNRLAVADVEPALIERIVAANRCDMELYTRARELWEEARARASRVPAVTASFVPAESMEVAVPPTVDPLADSLLPRTERGPKGISFSQIDLFDMETGGDATVTLGNPAEVRLSVYSTVFADDIHVGLQIRDEADLEVYGVSTQMQGRSLSLEGDTFTRVTFVFDMLLAPGGYHLNVVLQGGDTHDGKLFHAVDNAMVFWCVEAGAPGFTGVVDLRARMGVGKAEFRKKRRWRPPQPVRRFLRTTRERTHHGVLRGYQMAYNGCLRGYQLGYNSYLRAYQIAHDTRHRSWAFAHASYWRTRAFVDASRSAALQVRTVSGSRWHRTEAFLRWSLHRGIARLSYLRPPKLVRYILRTIKNERWGALKHFLSGKPPEGENHP